MRILVVEDYPAIARSLERQLRAILGVQVDRVTIATDLRAASTALRDDAVDLILLDLNLGGGDGFDLLRWAAAVAAHTIVVSGNTQRALEAFEHGVLDFVPKPVEPARLRRALARLNPRSAGADRPATRRLAVADGPGYRLIELATVRRIQAVGKYSEIHPVEGRPRIHDKPLERLEALLPDGFVRVHRSHVVNLTFARRLDVRSGGRYRLVLDDGSAVPVGRTRYAALRERMF
ncbi:MAG TPA: LytTR family DNA-binding domain-containing protein [Candidatus Polarisedimenticolaceae bacterium]|nr:LytTR family DNA-binding domain-containing protein [Candidatus Polarisedimenticolaceae bacterium]